MGIKFIREYDDIIKEISNALIDIDVFYSFISIEEDEWNELSDAEKDDILKTMADDIFYSLGDIKNIELGSGKISYSNDKNCIIIENNKCTSIIKLF